MYGNRAADTGDKFYSLWIRAINYPVIILRSGKTSNADDRISFLWARLKVGTK